MTRHRGGVAFDFTDEESWRESAACAGMAPEVFFPTAGHRPVVTICGGCPVRQPCLAYGKATRSVGVWGGVLLGWHAHGDVRHYYRVA